MKPLHNTIVVKIVGSKETPIRFSTFDEVTKYIGFDISKQLDRNKFSALDIEVENNVTLSITQEPVFEHVPLYLALNIKTQEIEGFTSTPTMLAKIHIRAKHFNAYIARNRLCPIEGYLIKFATSKKPWVIEEPMPDDNRLFPMMLVELLGDKTIPADELDLILSRLKLSKREFFSAVARAKRVYNKYITVPE